MELILKQDVENLGFTDDIVTVKNGYGRNFLVTTRFGSFSNTICQKGSCGNIESNVLSRKRKLLETLKKKQLS